MADALRTSIERGDFWHLDYPEALHLIASAFLPELKRLTNAPDASEQAPKVTNGHTSPPDYRSPSCMLFGNDYDEVNRTITGIWALRWIVSGDYDAFTKGQQSKARMTPESFRQLQDLFSGIYSSPECHFALMTAMIINDLGKDPQLAIDVERHTGNRCRNENHDFVLFEAVRAGMIHSMDYLDYEQKQALILGLKMGARLNLGQLAQAENVPGSLDVMIELRGHEYAFDMKFFEQLLDVAGAAGHIDSTSAKVLSEPVFQSFMTVRKVLKDILNGHSNLRQGYDEVLLSRAAMLEEKGFRKLSAKDSTERALLRLIAMGRTTSKEQAEWFESAFYSLELDTRNDLVKGLNVDGWHDGKAVLPYYMPALLSAGLNNTIDGSANAKSEALSSLMLFLTRVLAGTYPAPGSPGEVVEHDLMYAMKTISGAGFKKDPRILSSLPMTKAAIPHSLTI